MIMLLKRQHYATDYVTEIHPKHTQVYSSQRNVQTNNTIVDTTFKPHRNKEYLPSNTDTRGHHRKRHTYVMNMQSRTLYNYFHNISSNNFHDNDGIERKLYNYIGLQKIRQNRLCIRKHNRNIKNKFQLIRDGVYNIYALSFLIFLPYNSVRTVAILLL